MRRLRAALALAALLGSCAHRGDFWPTLVYSRDGGSNFGDGLTVAIEGEPRPTPDVRLVTWPELEPVLFSTSLMRPDPSLRLLRVRSSEPLEPRWYAVLVDVPNHREYQVGGVPVEPDVRAFRIFGTSAPRITAIRAEDRETFGYRLSGVSMGLSEPVLVPEGTPLPILVSTPEGPCPWFEEGRSGPVDDLQFGCDVDHVEQVRVEVLQMLPAANGDGALVPQIIEDAETYVDPPPSR